MGETEQEGFDESSELQRDELIHLELEEGKTLECVLLSVVEYDGQLYALLSELAEPDGEIMVLCYDENTEGASRFSPLEDDSVLVGLEAVVSTLLSAGDDVN